MSWHFSSRNTCIFHPKKSAIFFRPTSRLRRGERQVWPILPTGVCKVVMIWCTSGATRHFLSRHRIASKYDLLHSGKIWLAGNPGPGQMEKYVEINLDDFTWPQGNSTPLNQPVKINTGWFHVSRAVKWRFGPDSRAKEMAICVVILFPGPPPVPLESFVALLSGRLT